MQTIKIHPRHAIDRVLKVKEATSARRYPKDSDPILWIAPKGEKLKVHSFVERGNVIWWQFLSADGRQYHIKHSAQVFDMAFLRDQIPEKELAKDQKRPSGINPHAIGMAIGFSTALFVKNPFARAIGGAVGLYSATRFVGGKLDGWKPDLNPFG
jgi:hypothetical protein